MTPIDPHITARAEQNRPLATHTCTRGTCNAQGEVDDERSRERDGGEGVGIFVLQEQLNMLPGTHVY